MPKGDRTRYLPGLASGFFTAFNRYKKSIALDIKTPGVREIADHPFCFPSSAFRDLLADAEADGRPFPLRDIKRKPRSKLCGRRCIASMV